MAVQPFVRPWLFLSFLILYTIGRTPWMGDQPVVRPLPTKLWTQKLTESNKITGHSIWTEWKITAPKCIPHYKTIGRRDVGRIRERERARWTVRFWRPMSWSRRWWCLHRRSTLHRDETLFTEENIFWYKMLVRDLYYVFRYATKLHAKISSLSLQRNR
jgi:hypothetical protein